MSPNIGAVTEDFADAGYRAGVLPPGRRAGDLALGLSAGGHLSYLAACRLPISRTAVLYGGWLPTTDIPLSQPSPTLDLTPGITGRLLYLVGENDFLITAEQRRQIGDALRSAGVSHEIIVYPGTAHAFFWPGTPAFNSQSRDDAWTRILALLDA